MHASEPDAAEVLYPFEIADGHAAGIGIEIRDDHRAPFAKDRIGFCRDWAVRRLDDQGCLDPFGVFLGDHKFHGSRDQDVGILFQHLHAAVDMARIAANTAGGDDMRLQRFNVYAGFVDDSTVAFQDMGDQRPVLGRQKQGGVIADIAKPLNDDPLALETGAHAGFLHIIRMVEESAKRVFDPAPRRLGPAGYSALRHRLAGDTGPGIDLGRVEPLIFIRHPGHLALAGADIRRRHVL